MSTILLDIDGVLRPSTSHDTPVADIVAPSLITHWNGSWDRFEILQSEVPEFFEHFPSIAPTKYNTIVSVELMQSLLSLQFDGHDIHWFTLWGEFVSILSSNLSGFGENFTVNLFDSSHDFEWVKMKTLKNLLDSNRDEFFVLVDDTALDDEQSVEMLEAWVDSGQLGVVVPTPHRGISRTEMDSIRFMATKRQAGILS